MIPQTRLDERLCCVLLAAGGSARLGRPKQLLRRRVRPLLLDAYRAAAEVLPGRVLVVLGADALRMRRMLARHAGGARVVKNARWREGMGSSLRLGLACLPPACSAALVALCDQPEVDGLALDRLIAAWRRRPGHPAAAAYAGRLGVPAVLPRRLWHAVGDGDRGARELLRGSGPVSCVDMPEATIDVDTREDFDSLAAAPRRRLKMRRRPLRARGWRN